MRLTYKHLNGTELTGWALRSKVSEGEGGERESEVVERNEFENWQKKLERELFTPPPRFSLFPSFNLDWLSTRICSFIQEERERESLEETCENENKVESWKREFSFCPAAHTHKLCDKENHKVEIMREKERERERNDTPPISERKKIRQVQTGRRKRNSTAN